MKKSELFQSICNLTVVLSLLTFPCYVNAQETFPYIGNAVPGIITDIELASTSGWEGVIHTGGLTDGAMGFIDRDYQWLSIPAQLVGADYIETAQNNADVHPFALDVTVKEGTMLHLLIPEHKHLLPFAWMTKSVFGAYWIDTGALITTSWSNPAQVWSTITPLAAGTYTFRDLPLDPITGSYLSFYGIAATTDAKNWKVDICHWQPDNNAWKLIRVSTASIAGHFSNHDDAFPGGTTAQSGTTLAEDCEIALPECGDCLVNNGTPGCENGACTDIVCSIDPFCCNVFWDDLCAEEAAEYCLDEVCVAGSICGIPTPLEEGICLCGFPELFCSYPIINCETSEDCSEISCGGLPTCVKAGNYYPDECGPDNSEGCYYVVE